MATAVKRLDLTVGEIVEIAGAAQQALGLQSQLHPAGSTVQDMLSRNCLQKCESRPIQRLATKRPDWLGPFASIGNSANKVSVAPSN